MNNECNHEHWLYVPQSVGIGDNTLTFLSGQFICADCGQWIGIGDIDINKIINVEKRDRSVCDHDLKIYTLSSRYICLRCGHEWMPAPARLEITKDYQWEERDKLKRAAILAEFKDGKMF